MCVWDAFLAAVADFRGFDSPVYPAAYAQNDGGQQCGDERAGHDGDLHVVVPVATASEGQLADEQGHGEADACKQCQSQDVPPRQTGVEFGAGEPRDEPGGQQHAKRLADDQAERHAEGDAVCQRAAEPLDAVDRDPGTEEGKQGNGDGRGQGSPPVFQVLGHAGTGAGVAAVDRHGEGEQDAGDGRVQAGGVDQDPDARGQREQDPPGADTPLNRHREQGQRDDREQQGSDGEVAGVEESDNGDGEQVVDDGQGEQEGAQRGGKVRADDGEHGQGEGDVGGRGDGPPARVAGATEVYGGVEERGNRDAADRGGHRDRG